MRKTMIALSMLGAFALPTSAHATTGSGCYVLVNVPSWDSLNVRSRPSSSSSVVGQIFPNGGSIISGGRSAQDARNKCVPKNRALGSRWCPVSVVTGGASFRGWAKRRYLRPNDCP